MPPKDVPKDARAEITSIFEKVDGRGELRELNLYISGYDEDLEGAETPSASAAAGAQGQPSAESGQPGMTPEESPTR